VTLPCPVGPGYPAPTSRDGTLDLSKSRIVTNAAFAFFAVAAAAVGSQLFGGARLALPSPSMIEASLTDYSDVVRPRVAPAAQVDRLATGQAREDRATSTQAVKALLPANPAPAAPLPEKPASATSLARTPAPAASVRARPDPPSRVTVALTSALAVRGVPYVWGGASPRGFDCSGLVQWAYRRAGVLLPRTSQQQSRVGTPVTAAQLRPGDLVFFYTPVHHVGIYLGNGMVLNAPDTGDVVRVTPLSHMPFHNARRVV
jgi:cell wall-associated NlpC family hydrolase